MAERTYNERVDDTILVGAFRISRIRQESVRTAIEGHREQCVLNDQDSRGTASDRYWSHRASRCEALMQEPSDDLLRKRAVDALVREERG